MVDYLKLIYFFNNFLLIYTATDFSAIVDKKYIHVSNYVFWPNATVPFYINPNHFDHEQSLAIMTTLSMFAFKTCLKFTPVMAPPVAKQHVLTFVNPDGIRRCVVDVQGHSVFDPHYLIIGYDCLKSPHLEMTIMKALGFPFEHNRHSRDVFVEVLYENIEPGSIELFSKDTKLPQELQSLPYDYNSVMHFGDREYSKNGHRTIIFRDHKIVQNRVTLTTIDLRKIEIVYGPECLKRDRQEKIDLCQGYPGVARRKRDIVDEIKYIQETVETNIEPEISDHNKLRKKRDINDVAGQEHVINDAVTLKETIDNSDVAGQEHVTDKAVTVKQTIDVGVVARQEPVTDNAVKVKEKIDNKENKAEIEPVIKNLRVNRNITPPPTNETNVSKTLKDLGIEDEVTEIVEKVYKVASLALKNARDKYCNNTKSDLRTGPGAIIKNSSDVLGIIESIANYSVSIVNDALEDLPALCASSGSIEEYQRAGCPFYDKNRCRETYRSTKFGRPQYSTQHRPTYYQFTKHDSHGKIRQYGRSGNNPESSETITEATKFTESKAAINNRIKKEDEGEPNAELAGPSKNKGKLKTKSDDVIKETSAGGKRDVEEKLSSVDKRELPAKENHTVDDVTSRKKRDIANVEKLTTDDENHKNLNEGDNQKISESDQVSLASNSTVDDSTKHKTDKVDDIKEKETSAIKEKGLKGSRRHYLIGRRPRSDLPSNVLSKLVLRSNSAVNLRSRGDEDNQSGGIHTDSAETYKKKPIKHEEKEEKPEKKRMVNNNDRSRSDDDNLSGDTHTDSAETSTTKKSIKHERKEEKPTEKKRMVDRGRSDDDNQSEGTHTVSAETYKKKKSMKHERKEEKPTEKKRMVANDRSRSDEDNQSRGTHIDSAEMYKKKKSSKNERNEEKLTEKKSMVDNNRSRSDDDNHSRGTHTDSAETYKKKKSSKNERNEKKPTEKKSMVDRSDNNERDFRQRKKSVPQSVTLTKANIEFYKERRWPGGVVRYIIKEDPAYNMDDLRERLNAVRSILHKKTCVKLKEITEDDASKYDDYLVLDTSQDYVTGRVGGKQHFGSVELFRGNQHKQHTAMMVMAMLGFYFEVSRHDRDKHVRVHMRHVRPDKLHHFEKIREEATFDLPYDYESATHPAWQFWRKIGKTGISTVATFKQQDPDASIMKLLGQNDKLLSDLDIVKINSIYGHKCFQTFRAHKEEKKRSTNKLGGKKRN